MFVFGFLMLGLVAALGYAIYLAAIIGGAIVLTGLVLIFGVYVTCIENLGPEVTWSIIAIAGVCIGGFLLYKVSQQQRAEAARLAEEERLRVIALEVERQRRAALDAANKLASELALAKPWQNRSWDDWKRVWFD